MPDSPQHTNRLAQQKSPYLLQHAHNPVDWYPWGEEAFTKATEENKPIFLSIGYATCHWCHVMERESFENAEIANLMNNTFVNIKVDREELPDVDHLYMDFAQSMITGATGWPLNLLLTPTLKPFFAMTYLPPEQRYGMLGMKQFVTKIQELWSSEEKEQMIEQADKIFEIFQQHQHQKGDTLPDPDLITIAMEEIYHRSDSTFGGIRGAPKFPLGYQISFLINYAFYSSDSRGLFLANKTLEMMHRGGIYDHLGGGFSRYSVDEKWLIPHFEKMLYDNALLLDSYLDGWLATGKAIYQEVCEEMIAYIFTTMTHEKGGFFCAEDSETHGSEGLYYTWLKNEVELLLQNDFKEHFLAFYNITSEGNFEGANVLNTPKSLEEYCEEKKIDIEKTQSQFKNMRTLLLKVRNTREKPFKDDKILTSWNGLMIHSLARTGVALNHPEYIEAAKKAATFLHTHLWADGILYRRWRDDARAFIGNLDDYAHFIRALLTLFEVDANWQWLKCVLDLTEKIDEQFKKGEIFFQTSEKKEHLILRKSQFSDGSEPSGTAIHCENLLRLYEMTGENKYLAGAEEILKDVKPYLESFPSGYIYHLRNLLRHRDQNKTLIIVALDEHESDKEIISYHFFSRYRLHHSIVWLPLHQKRNFLTLEGKEAIDGKTTIYVCHQGVCKAPQNVEEWMTS